MKEVGVTYVKTPTLLLMRLMSFVINLPIVEHQAIQQQHQIVCKYSVSSKSVSKQSVL